MSKIERAAGAGGLSEAEERRLAVLRSTELLDSPPEREFDRLTKIACRLLNVPIALLTLVDEDRIFLKSSRGLAGPWDRAREVPLDHSLCAHVVRAAAPLMVEDARQHAAVQPGPAVEQLGMVAYLGVPLKAAGEVTIGALCAVDGQPRPWTSEDLEALTDLAKVAANELALRRATMQDPLTGVANRRRFQKALAGAVEAAGAEGRSITVLLLDLNNFQDVNEAHGVDLGDILLSGVAQRILDEVTGEDLVARLGGDEFAVLLHGEPPLASVRSLGERIVESVGQPHELGPFVLQCGASIGIVQRPADPHDPAGLMVAAEAALAVARGRRKRSAAAADQAA